MHFLAFTPLLRALVIFTATSRVPAHGLVASPTPRHYGAVAEAGCGEAVYKVLTSDLYGPIENAVKKISSQFNPAMSFIFLSRSVGSYFAIKDNEDNTRKYTPGEVVHFKVDLEARHTGRANVSVVDLTSQTPIGSPLITWPVYANDSLGPDDWPKSETDFSVAMPDLNGRCSKSGECAIQWWWYAYSNDQTYESCVDFTQ